MTIPSKDIFKAYDIRGIVGRTLTADVVKAIGHAIGSEAAARGQTTIAIGRDGRLSGPEFAHVLARGIQNSGVNVIDLGQVATPMTYFAAHQLACHCAVMITGSHNPPEYNGLKMVLAGETLYVLEANPRASRFKLGARSAWIRSGRRWEDTCLAFRRPFWSQAEPRTATP